MFGGIGMTGVIRKVKKELGSCPTLSVRDTAAMEVIKGKVL